MQQLLPGLDDKLPSLYEALWYSTEEKHVNSAKLGLNIPKALSELRYPNQTFIRQRLEREEFSRKDKGESADTKAKTPRGYGKVLGSMWAGKNLVRLTLK